MNRIDNYECFQVVGFEILAKNEKMKKMFENDLGKSRENENRPKNETPKFGFKCNTFSCQLSGHIFFFVR